MRDVASINQTGSGIRLPNFCNLGIMLRLLIIVNLLCLAAAAGLLVVLELAKHGWRRRLAS